MLKVSHNHIANVYEPQSVKTSLNDEVVKIKLLHTLNVRSKKKLSCILYGIISIIHGNLVF